MISLLHVSDVHFGPKHLPEVSAALLELARATRPTAVVVSGDLTQRAKPRQFREARDWIDALPGPVSFVPGNHDVPMYRFWERLFAPWAAWRGAFDRALVREVATPELAVFGLNTAHPWTTKHGRVARRELEALGARIDAAPAGAVRALAAHHPLAPGRELGHEPVARGSAAALELCRRAGVELVLSGHLHHGFWLEASRGERGPSPLVVHSGTTSSSRGRGPEKGRCSFNWIEIDRAAIRVERRFWRLESGDFRTEFAAEHPRSGSAPRAAGPDSARESAASTVS